MDFELTDEQRLIQNTVHEFVDARVLPNAIENDINHHLDMGVIEGMGELGLLGIVLDGVTAQVGLTCSPISVIGVGSGSACSAQAVCCENNSVVSLRLSVTFSEMLTA